MNLTETNTKHTIDHKGTLRYDFLFSYWMFIWFILFWLLPKNDNLRSIAHPAFTLAIGVLENTITLLLILYYNPQWSIIWKFVAMMIAIKILPLYLVMYESTPLHVPWQNSIITFIVVFAIYLGYLFVNDANFVEIYKTAIVSVIMDENKTPLYSTLMSITSAFRKSGN